MASFSTAIDADSSIRKDFGTVLGLGFLGAGIVVSFPARLFDGMIS
jgi:hypothetical protein